MFPDGRRVDGPVQVSDLILRVADPGVQTGLYPDVRGRVHIPHWDRDQVQMKDWSPHQTIRTCPAPQLKRKCCHFDEIFVTGCTESCHLDNFQCSQ